MVKAKKPIIPPPEAESYHVEVITKARVAPLSSDEDEDNSRENRSKKKKKTKKRNKASARWEYYVAWAGYDSDSNSWEPEDNVAGCQRLLASFWGHVGTDNDDYPVGYVVEARDDWIKMEKKFFRTEYDDAQRRLRVERELAERERTTRLRKALKKRPVRDDISVYVARSSKHPVPSITLSISDDDSQDDKPLSTRVTKRKRESVLELSDDDAQISRKTPKTDRATDNEQPKQSYEDDPVPDSLFSASPSPVSQPSQPLPKPPPPPVPTSVKTTTIVPPPKLPRRAPNPHAKIAEMVPQSIASNSGISTKQRLAQGALAPTRPNAMPLPTPRDRLPPPVKSGSSSLMPLSFKKKLSLPTSTGSGGTGFFSMDETRTPISPHTPSEQWLTPSALNASASPRTEYPEFPQVVAPPIDYVMNEDSALPEASTSLPVLQPPPRENPLVSQAEDFLQSIMPPALAAPLTSAIEMPHEPAPPRALIPRKPMIQQRIPKKWTWSGSVYIDADTSEPLCNVTFCDVTDSTSTQIPFSVALAPSDNLEFLTFHDIVDLPAFLSACRPPHQYARLIPQENKDIENLHVLGTFMVKHQKVILVPTLLDDILVGHILVFPSSDDLCQYLKVPFSVYVAQAHVSTFLVAALVSWSLSPTQISKQWRLLPSSYLPSNVNSEPAFSEKARWERSVRTKPAYHHALRILRFPTPLHKFMSEPYHGFTVWWDGGDGSKKRVGIETHFLFTIMEQCRAKKVNYSPRLSNDPRVVFVHVGAIRTLHQLPGFLEFCGQSLTQFWTYGTHESISPERWGVREIYPYGGVVTFTPEAISNDYIEVLRRIKQIQSHPLWVCYILPSVVGMVANDEGDDPLVMFDNGKFPLLALLTAIEDGELALLTAPPRSYYAAEPINPQQQWLRNHWTHRPLDARSILKFCVDAYHMKYANLQKTELTSAIKTEISYDISSMRQQPALIAEYRRYVVLKSVTDVYCPVGDGLEWTTSAQFDFKDNFFLKE